MKKKLLLLIGTVALTISFVFTSPENHTQLAAEETPSSQVDPGYGDIG
ncbi:hypothetical protein NC797_10910 [Aquibacillus sp. 3ASR75-11]|uniref:Phr family secreted Rap phosphatase inhibitor n=1 Tax=Terrihalobacillus insolitus TaxID=2950438 RepID=A0A9X3WXB1_9BACI|nr:hypothetical protein [Terrihalobacillus insolitus]MDC3411807.1 hypothetical protein [Terrihalobacillus insolitus]MDC3425014.1 hypothetical protein [Terrihalobacillus insolitus]